MPHRPPAPVARPARQPGASALPAGPWRIAIPQGGLGLPAWVDRTIGTVSDVSNAASGVVVRRGQGGVVLSAILANAERLSSEALEQTVESAYTGMAAWFAREAAGHDLFPVRFWNFIPAIHEPMTRSVSRSPAGPGQPPEVTRYMVFNAGRFRAIEHWRTADASIGPPLGAGIAAATGVGHSGPDLAIHCLALDRPGRAVENSRQVPAYRYSTRYGPLPPCFARGTVVETRAGRRLLVAGTASVRGEESVHTEPGERRLAMQVEETLANLQAVVGEAAGACGPAVAGALARLSDVRVYYPEVGGEARVASLLEGRFAPGGLVEFVRADICRPELLVEIEGVADLD
jgi:chorismate lyase/3-hydroxybenzoate synthase